MEYLYIAASVLSFVTLIFVVSMSDKISLLRRSSLATKEVCETILKGNFDYRYFFMDIRDKSAHEVNDMMNILGEFGYDIIDVNLNKYVYARLKTEDFTPWDCVPRIQRDAKLRERLDEYRNNLAVIKTKEDAIRRLYPVVTGSGEAPAKKKRKVNGPKKAK